MSGQAKNYMSLRRQQRKALPVNIIGLEKGGHDDDDRKDNERNRGGIEA